MRLGFAAMNDGRRLFGEALPHDRERAQHALAIEMRFARDRRAGGPAYKPLQQSTPLAGVQSKGPPPRPPVESAAGAAPAASF